MHANIYCRNVYSINNFKQPKYPSTDEEIKKMWYKYTVGYYSINKKNEIMSFAAIWMTMEIIILTEANKMEKGRYHALIYKTDLQISGVFGYKG